MLTKRCQTFGPTMLFHDPFDRMLHQLDRAFSDVVWHGSPLDRQVFPALNVWEDDDHVFVEAELPGLKMDEVDIVIEGDELRISGKRDADQSDDRVNHRRERYTGSFSRTIRLRDRIDQENVKATLQHGILTVTLPKAAETKPRRIAVKAVDG